MLNHPIRLVGIILVMLTVVLASGCASMEKNNKQDALYYTSLRYAKALRWNDYQGAMKLTRLPDGQVDKIDHEYMKNIKVTNYELSPAIMSEDQTTGYVTLFLEYYNETVNSVHTVTVEQTWEYDEELKQWMCATPMPKFKP